MASPYNREEMHPMKGTALDSSNNEVDLIDPAAGAQKIVEQLAPVAEDNANGVIAITNKPLAVSTYSNSVFSNLGANATLNVKATPGNVFAAKCHNLNAAARYLQLHNTATTPGAGAVPFLTFLVEAGKELVVGSEFFGLAGLHFSTGIAFAFSTTEATYTAGTAAEQMTFVTYK